MFKKKITIRDDDRDYIKATYEMLSLQLKRFKVDLLDKRIQSDSTFKQDLINFAINYNVKISFKEGYCKNDTFLYGMPSVFRLFENKLNNEVNIELTEFAQLNNEIANCELLILVGRLIFSLNPLEIYDYHNKSEENFREFIVFFLIYIGYGNYLLERNSIINTYKFEGEMEGSKVKYFVPMNLNMMIHSMIYCNFREYDVSLDDSLSKNLDSSIRSQLKQSKELEWWK